MADPQIVTPEEAEAEGFVLAEHAVIFQQMCRQLKCYFSVRETGVYSLNRLKQGYAAKGHHILQKSLKPKSLKQANLPAARERWIMEKCGGLVGHWYKSKSGRKQIPDGVRTVEKWNIKNNSWVLDPGRAETYQNWVHFADIDKVGYPPPDAYTGDYDMHEILVRLTGRYIRAMSTPDSIKSEEDVLFSYNEAKCRPLARQGFSVGICGLINARVQRKRTNYKVESNPGMFRVDGRHKQLLDKFGQVIQHGAQCGFPAFTMTREGGLDTVAPRVSFHGRQPSARTKGLLGNQAKTNAHWIHCLVNFDPPVIGFYPDGRIKILKSVETIISAFYGHANCTVSPWWMQSHRIQSTIAKVKQMDSYVQTQLLVTLQKAASGEGAARRPSKIWALLHEKYLEIEGRMDPEGMLEEKDKNCLLVLYDVLGCKKR